MTNLKFSNTEEPFYNVAMDKWGNIYYSNKEGQLHRLNGPAIEYNSGRQEYWVNGRPHRLDGPAVIDPNGHKEYRVNGLTHRLDGPAIIWANGKVSYYIMGRKLTKREFDKIKRKQ